jgi:hypothetical protein
VGRGAARGRDLSALVREPTAGLDPAEAGSTVGVEAGNPGERFLLLRLPAADGVEQEVGLASEHFLYVRRPSPLDGSGQPVPAPELRTLEARYAEIGALADGPPGASAEAALAPAIWQRDVLGRSSPVPRLELHLARLLVDPESRRPAP